MNKCWTLKFKFLYKLFAIILIFIVAYPLVFKDYSSSASLNNSTTSIVTPSMQGETYLVKVKDVNRKNDIKQKYHLTDVTKKTDNSKNTEIDKWVKVKVKDKSDLKKLENDNNISIVVKDQQRKLFTTPDDPYFASTSNVDPNQDGQWNLRKICLGAFGVSSPCNSGWESASETGSANTVVAVIDTGINLNHTDLLNNIWTNPTPNSDSNYPNSIHGWNFADNNNNVQDINGHGTHVSGIIAAQGNNTNGISGICWSCKIMPLKVVNSSGYAVDSDIANAIKFATDHGARIINMSLGGPGYSQVLQDAVDYAWSGGNVTTPDLSKSVLVVSSSGNDSASASDSYPGGLLHSLSIGATNYQDTVASYSNTGPKLDVVAPGDNVLSSYISNPGGCLGSTNNYYCYLSGTSMASPHVAGLAALIFDKHPTWNSREVRSAILKYSYDVSPSAFSNSKGFGRINALNSLTSSVMASDTTNPVATLSTPSSGSTINGTVNITGTASDANLYIYMITFTRISNGAITQVAGRSSVTSGTLYSYDTTGLPNDFYNITMDVEDFAGNKVSSNTLSNVAIDNAAPGAFTTSSPSYNAWVNSSTPLLSWDAASSVSQVKYSVVIDGSTVATNLTSTSYNVSSNLSAGNHTWSVNAINGSGLTTASNTSNFNIDTVLPNDFSLGKNITSETATFTFSTTDNDSGLSRYDITLNGISYVNVTSPYTFSSLNDGNYNISVYAYDVAGNARIVSDSFSITYLKSKGDLNGNRKVDLSDLSILAQNYGNTTTIGDVNGDGKVDLSDLSILAQNWQNSF